MELANVSLVEELSSSDAARQIGGLLSLIQQFNAGRDIQSYLTTLTQVVLKKSPNSTVRKLCYHALRGCTIISKHDWDFVVAAIVVDINNTSTKAQQDKEIPTSKAAALAIPSPEALIEVCIAALRAVASFFTPQRLQTFFNSHKAAFETCLAPTSDYRIRLEAINTLKAIILSSSSTLSLLSSFSASSAGSTASTLSSVFAGQSMADVFGGVVLKALLDDSHVVSFTAFELLRILICSNSASSACCAYFYQEKLPIAITKENEEWLRFMSKHYSMLLARVHSMELSMRYPALRPLTYMTLMDEQLVNKTQSDDFIAKEQVSIFVSNVIRPMLSSVECGVLMEAVHCILLMSFNASSEITTNSNYIEDAMNACILLLDRAESASSYADIMKDICAVIDSLRDKYSICIRLLEHTHQIQDDVDRVYILSVVFRTLMQSTMNTKLSLLSKGVMLRVNEDSEIDMVSREIFFKRCLIAPGSAMERNLRHEILFCLSREFLSLQPPATPAVANSNSNSNSSDSTSPSTRAWLCVGLEICEMCRSCLTWEADTPVYCIMEFGKALTKLCVETYTPAMAQSDEKKLVHKILCHVFHSLQGMRTEVAKLVSVCILSNYLQLNMNIAGVESGDIVFDNVRILIRSFLAKETIDKQAIDALIYSMLYICMRFSLKLRDAQLFLRQTLESRKHRDEVYDSFFYALKKVDYSLKHNVVANGSSSSQITSDLIILFGKPFHEGHPIFKSHYSDLDFLFLRNYIKAFQLTKEVYLNQHTQSAYSFLSTNNKQQQQQQPSSSNNLPTAATSPPATAKKAHIAVPRVQTIVVKQPVKLQHSMIISQPSDPLFISAGYVLHPKECILVLRVIIHNESRIDMSDVSVQIGVDGSLDLFDQARQTSQFVGDLGGNGDNSQEIMRQFLVHEWSSASISVTVVASPKTKRPGDAQTADILSSSSRDDQELVTIRCAPLEIKLLHLLTPAHKLTHQDFTSCWESFHSAFHARIKIAGGANDPLLNNNSNNTAQGGVVSEKRLIERVMKSRPFYQVLPLSDIAGKSSFPTVNTFQLCFASKTIFYDDILLIITGSRNSSMNVCVCDLEFRSASEDVMNVVHDNADKFLSEIIGDHSHHINVLHQVSQESDSVDVFASMNSRVSVNVAQQFQLSSLQQVQLMLSRWAQLQQQ